MIVPSYFSNLAQSQNLQFLIDSSQANLEQQSIWRQWLTPGLPQVNLNFDAAIGRARIAAAASVVDPDSPAPLRSRPKLELYKGKIPAIKEKFRMTQEDMRSIEVLRALPLNGGNSNDALIAFLNKDLQEAAVSGDKRIDLMLLQAISTLSIDISTTNNPDGVAIGTIDLLPQSYQSQGVPIVWSSSSTATPIDDIEGYITINRDTRGRTFGKILMSIRLWNVFKKTTQVKSYLSGFYNTGRTADKFVVTLATINEYLTANNWPVIEIVEHNTAIESDGVPGFVRGFNDNNVAFVPNGKLGTLFNAISMETIHPVAGKNYASFGPTLVSKWAEQDPLVEYTGMEMNAFPAINIDSVFILKTETVQASFT